MVEFSYERNPVKNFKEFPHKVHTVELENLDQEIDTY